MKRYFKILFVYYKAWIMRDLEFRASLISMLAANFAWTNFTLVSILLINKNITRFGSWGLNELLILTGSWMLINFLMYTFVYSNIKRLMRDIFNGNLDFFLLKPIDNQFVVTIQRFNIGAFVSLFEGVIILIYAFIKGGYSFNLMFLVGFLLLIIFGALIYYSFWIFTAAINIFSPLADNLFYIVPEINYISKYPAEAFPQVMVFIFITIIPTLLITVLPAKMLMGQLPLNQFVYGIIISVIFFIASRKFWNWSLKHYTSASS